MTGPQYTTVWSIPSSRFTNIGSTCVQRVDLLICHFSLAFNRKGKDEKRNSFANYSFFFPTLHCSAQFLAFTYACITRLCLHDPWSLSKFPTYSTPACPMKPSLSSTLFVNNASICKHSLRSSRIFVVRLLSALYLHLDGFNILHVRRVSTHHPACVQFGQYEHLFKQFLLHFFHFSLTFCFLDVVNTRGYFYLSHYNKTPMKRGQLRLAAMVHESLYKSL